MDTVGVAKTYEDKLSRQFPSIRFTVESKARPRRSDGMADGTGGSGPRIGAPGCHVLLLRFAIPECPACLATSRQAQSTPDTLPRLPYLAETTGGCDVPDRWGCQYLRKGDEGPGGPVLCVQGEG